MTLDEHPYCNAEPKPLLIQSSGSQMVVVKSESDGEGEIREVDMDLYADYELMYSRAAEEAREETGGVVESQWYDAYITELSRQPRRV